jgi:GntR family transcriptional regulator
MHLIVSAGDDLPIYRQIMRQITEGIAGGRLRAGDQLPSHRDLSEQLVIAPLTVKKAYDELESLGYIESQRGRGTFVSARSVQPARKAQAEQLSEMAKTLLSHAYLVNLTLADVVKILRDADRTIAKDTPRSKNQRVSA